MNKKYWKVVYFVLAILMCTSTVIMASGQLESMKKEKQEIESQIQKKSEEISQIAGDIDAINREIRIIDSRIQQSQDELNKIQKEINILNGEIDKTIDELNEARENLVKREEDLANRAREQYMNGDVMFLDVIFGSSSITEMLTKLDIVQSVMEQDKELMDFTDKQIKYIEEIEERLRIQEAELKEMKKVELEKISQLEATNVEKEAYLSALMANKEFVEGEYNEYLGKSSDLEQQIQQLEKELEEKRLAEKKRLEEQRRAQGTVNHQVSGSGQLAWPMPGHNRISSPYGYRVHPIFGTRKFHAGIDIPAPTGTPVTAAAEGIVIYSGWQGGYGNCVMVSHGDGLVTLYAHNSALSVSVGDYVSTGDTVALCGSTGYSTGPHLHFEVRINGSTVDPLGWL